MPETAQRSGPPRSARALAQPGVHPCPCSGCPTLVPPGLVACREHWARIPKPDRQILADAFRQRETNPALYALAVTTTSELLHHYEQKAPA